MRRDTGFGPRSAFRSSEKVPPSVPSPRTGPNPWPFSEREIALLHTFADQAVIAIENVRLFKLQARNRDLTEALEQQTATAEILRVISTSPTNLEPVLDAVVKIAARFCGAPDASVFRLDGEALRVIAHHGPVSQPTGFLVPIVRGSVAGRSLLERQAVGVTDLQVETEEFPEGSALARQTGQRATLGVPLLREGMPIGVILLRRAEAVPFTDKQIALLQTFADQAVIAIENVRLFSELGARNRELTEPSSSRRRPRRSCGSSSRSPTDSSRCSTPSSERRDAVRGGVLGLTSLMAGPPPGRSACFRAWGSTRCGTCCAVPAPTGAGRAIPGRASSDWTDVDIAEARRMPRASATLAAGFHGFRCDGQHADAGEGNPIGAIDVNRDEGRPFTESRSRSSRRSPIKRSLPSRTYASSGSSRRATAN